MQNNEHQRLHFGGIVPAYRIPTISMEMTAIQEIAKRLNDRLPLGISYQLWMQDAEFLRIEHSGVGRSSYDGERAVVSVRVGLELSGVSGHELRVALADLYLQGSKRLVQFMKKKRPDLDLSQFPFVVEEIMQQYIDGPPAGPHPDKEELDLYADYFQRTGKLHPLAIKKNREARLRRTGLEEPIVNSQQDVGSCQGGAGG